MSDISASTRSAVVGSDRTIPNDSDREGPIDGSAIADVTIVVRPRSPMPNLHAGATEIVSRAAFAETYGASQEDLEAVETFARAAGLTVESTDVARRSVVVRGTLDALARAFEADLATYAAKDGLRFRGRVGALTVPASLSTIVVGVFGLDERAQARTHFVWNRRPATARGTSYSPIDVANAYGFPSGTGQGETIALIELGGGYVEADLRAYFTTFNVLTPAIASVGVDGATNAPTGKADGPDAEVMLDIEVAGAIAPEATIVVYFAPNTDRGFLDAITTAVHDTVNAPSILSISWGGPESTWTAQATKNFDDAFAAAAMLGMTVTVAAGDNGSSDGVGDGAAHVDFPASSPHVLACGGTRLSAKGATVEKEVVWNDGAGGGATGGGVSDVFDLPAWQSDAHVPQSTNPGGRIGRGVPDVAGNADPESGYTTRVDGTVGVIGGTSAVAPLWAGLIARINGNLAKRIGFANPQLYASRAALRDITHGNNGAYSAKTGWDACTGLGSPKGALVEKIFASAQAKRSR